MMNQDSLAPTSAAQVSDGHILYSPVEAILSESQQRKSCQVDRHQRKRKVLYENSQHNQIEFTVSDIHHMAQHTRLCVQTICTNNPTQIWFFDYPSDTSVVLVVTMLLRPL